MDVVTVIIVPLAIGLVLWLLPPRDKVKIIQLLNNLLHCCFVAIHSKKKVTGDISGDVDASKFIRN